MASYNELNALIDAYINRNGVQAITGQILNGVLKAMVEQLGRGYTIMGAAIPATDPGTPDGPECYFASTPGTYTDFDGLQVVPGELALLCYTPSEGWTKATIYEGFRQVGATIDGNVGTPSVGVSYANGVLSFDFHNMKGNPGQDGQDGAAAGFGTIGADITGGVGTPGVSVESSGPATAKNLQFHFTNLKGETGVTSVVATVDNTTGTPACTVSLVGQQLTLAFTGLKGAQGDTGSSVDYPFTIVNNLTTDDATQALSAAQGYVLDGKVSQLEAKVTDIYSDLVSVMNFSIVWNDNNLLRNNGGITVITSGSYFNRCATSDGIPCAGMRGKKITVVHGNYGTTAIAFYYNPDNMVSGSYQTFSGAGTETIVVPATADYFRLGTTTSTSADLSNAKNAISASGGVVISPVTKPFVKGIYSKYDYIRELYIPDKTKTVSQITFRKAMAQNGYRNRIEVYFTDSTSAYFDYTFDTLAEALDAFNKVVTDSDNKFYVLFSDQVPVYVDIPVHVLFESADPDATHILEYYPAIKDYIAKQGQATQKKMFSEQFFGAIPYALPTDFDYSQLLFFGQSFAQGGSSKTGTTGVIPNCKMFGTNVKATTGSSFNPLEQSTYEYPVVSCANALSQMYRRYGHNINIVASTAGTGGVSITTLIEQYVANVEEMQENMKAVADGENKSVGCFAIVYMQGETDYREWNVGGKDAYKAKLLEVKNALQQSCLENLGQTRKPIFFLYQTSGSNWINNYGEQDNEALGVSMAQIEFAQENDDVILISPAYQVTRYSDGHPSTNGERWLGEYYAKAIWQTLYRGFRYKNPVPMDYLVEPLKITIFVSNCTLPLIKNTWTCPQKTNYGFNVKADGNDVTIDSIELIDNAIVLNLGTPISSATTIKLSYGGIGVGQGNICDSDSWATWLKYLSDSGDTGYDGTRIINQSPTAEGGGSLVGMDYPMNNFLCIFYKEITQ